MTTGNISIGYDHIAYATKNTDETMKLLETLGFTLIVYKGVIHKFNAYITKMASSSGQVAEIVEPIGPSSVVSEFLKDKSAGVYHTCFRTDDFHRSRKLLQASGALAVTKPMEIPFPATDQHKTFLTTHMYHVGLGLFEISGPYGK